MRWRKWWCVNHHWGRFMFARTLIRETTAFIESNDASRHIWLDQARFYVRKSYRPIGGSWRRTLDIASVEVVEPYRRMGYFSIALVVFQNQVMRPSLALIENIDKVDHGLTVVYFESVLNDDLATFLMVKHQYQQDLMIYPPSFYRIMRP